jgi:hypothetical protein
MGSGRWRTGRQYSVSILYMSEARESDRWAEKSCSNWNRTESGLPTTVLALEYSVQSSFSMMKLTVLLGGREAVKSETESKPTQPTP